MIVKKFSIALVLLNIFSMSPVFSTDSQDNSSKQKVEEIIKQCETKYQDTKSKEILFSQKPEKWTITRWDLAKSQGIFKKKLWEFAEFTSKEKIKLRASDGAKTQDYAKEFSSNCSRFSEGISGFADWATGRKIAAKGSVDPNIYKMWMKEK